MAEQKPGPCPYCGAKQENCGPPIWDYYCTNKDCTGMRDEMFASVRERIAKDKALREAAPDLLEALEAFRGYGCPVCSGDCGSANPPVASCPMNMASSAIAKARNHPKGSH